jgi:signal transduction histidine kinase
MRVTQRATRPTLATVVDVGIATVGVGLTAVALWRPHLIGTATAPPRWMLVALPLLIGAPLALRRRAPVLMWTAVWVGVSLQALNTQNPAHGPELVFVLFLSSYSLAAHSRLRRALVGLTVMAPGVAICILAAHGSRGGILAVREIGGERPRGASLLFVGEILAFWLVGVVVRARREAASFAARNAALERQAERAVDAERTRIARELHDIVAHHLSVVVLQAAGARASGKPAAAVLEKIEQSGRAALIEMRRLLGVLHERPEDRGLSPQPGVGQLAALAESVRAVGVPVHLVVDGDVSTLPAAVDVSAYRIVQEALTNVLKHAGPARAEVAIGCVSSTLTIEVTDDGAGMNASQPSGGNGLVGMRERVAIFGGELIAGPGPDGGFAVRARLPFCDEPS